MKKTFTHYFLLSAFLLNLSYTSTGVASEDTKIAKDHAACLTQKFREIAENNKDCFIFGTVEDNKVSFEKWVAYSDSLYQLAKLGDEAAKQELSREFEGRKYRLEIIDCYTYGKPLELCLLGIWNQVATFDLNERAKLIAAAEKGKEIRKDLSLVSFWKNYSSPLEGLQT